MIPIHGARPCAARRYRRRPGVYALMPRGGRILLTFQATPVPELQLPCGGIDPGENPMQTLVREMREETGWTIRARRLLGRYRQYGYIPEYEIWAEKVCTIYLARPVLRVSSPHHPEHTVVWATPSEAAVRLSNAGDCAFVARFLKDWM